MEEIKNLIREEKNLRKKNELRKILASLRKDLKEEQQKRKETQKHMRSLMKTRGFWNSSANEKHDSLYNPPELLSDKSYYKHYRIKNKLNAKTIKKFLSAIEERTLSTLETNKKVIFTLSVTLTKRNALNSKETMQFHFTTPPLIILDETDKQRSFSGLLSIYSTRLQEEMLEGSGWYLKSIDSFGIKLLNYNPIKGGDFVELPKSLAKSKSVLQFENMDEKCLKWAITRCFFPQSGNHLSPELFENSTLLNWDNIHFPADERDIKQFEKNNPGHFVYVYGKDENGKNYIFYKNSKMCGEKIANLLFYKGHFFPIVDEKNYNRYIFNSRRKCYDCKHGLNNFSNEDLLILHSRYCQKEFKCRIKYPLPKTCHQFKKHPATMFHPIICYFDIEACLVPVQQKIGEKTENVQKHTFSKLGLYVINNIENTKYYKCFTSVDDFFHHLYKEVSDKIEYEYIPHFRQNIPNIDKSQYKKCEYCDKKFSEEDYRVIHHSHLTGEFLGVVHNSCNLKLKEKYFIPLVAHNLSKYDEKFLIRECSDVKIIAKNIENFISFSCNNTEGIKFQFIDSLKFLNSSLFNLMKSQEGNLPHLKEEFGDDPIFLEKGIFPFDYVTSNEVLNETSLPSYEEWPVNRLTGKKPTKEEYKKALKMWDLTNCKTLGDYQELYLKIDVLGLADVFENFRKTMYEKYGIDPAHYITLGSYSLDCLLKFTNEKLEKISDPTIYNFLERGIRGGESFIGKRHAIANNPYLKDYDPSKPTSYIWDIDENNLYGEAMMKYLPYSNFRFLSEEEIKDYDWKNNLCILDVDFHLPEHLKDYFKEYPLFPEHYNGKLVGTLFPKSGYVVLSEYLKYGIEKGYVLDKINNILVFNSKKVLSPYIEENTKMRTQAKFKCEKDQYKLMNNIIFGKTIENVRDRINVKFYKTGDPDIAKHNFKNILDLGSRTLIEMGKLSVTLDKPIYIGAAILDYAKLTMAKFFYDYLKPRYRFNLLMTDTDSFMLEIFTEDIYEDILKDIDTCFDTSEFPSDFKTLSGNSIPPRNKKVPGYMKDESPGVMITKFCGLRSKQYCFVDENEKETRKGKGVPKSVDICFEDYEECLFKKKNLQKNIYVIRSDGHNNYTQKITKICLDPNDEKRQILEDDIHTLPWGY